ncbi:hypothetical protein B0J17DRAFT_771662 [Rhizoctonia solani]|nr:hypothetical protein B0J17DRAFT_771662 [Rhizoctonia solani]
MKTSTSDDSASAESFPLYPDCIAQVCSRWRQIALSSPSLWSHIDYAPQQKLDCGMLARAKAYMKRASSLSIILHIHIHEHMDVHYKKDNLEHFLMSVACRTKSLDYTTIRPGNAFTRLVLMTLLRGSATGPAVFTQLKHTTSFTGMAFMHDPHIMSADQDLRRYDSAALNLDLPESVIEESFSNLSILHLRGLYPSWSSAPYHGLVDLRLIGLSSSYRHPIPESKFRNILKASPRLRILNFSLVVSKQSRDTRITPVYLEDLEKVNIATRHPRDGVWLMISEPGAVLRLFAPGSKFLQLSISHYIYQPHESSVTDLKYFFRRSRITKFYGKGACPPLGELLSHAPNLRVLELDVHNFKLSPANESRARILAASKLERLILPDWDYRKLDELDLLLQYHPTETVIFLNYNLRSRWDQVGIWKRHPETRVLTYNLGKRPLDPLGGSDVFSENAHRAVPIYD